MKLLIRLGLFTQNKEFRARVLKINLEIKD